MAALRLCLGSNPIPPAPCSALAAVLLSAFAFFLAYVNLLNLLTYTVNLLTTFCVDYSKGLGQVARQAVWWS